MGESRRKKERRPSVKPTDKLPPIPLAADRAVCARQRAFCRTLIGKLLDDESSLSFSKPVLELWDASVLGDYFEKIAHPMDLGTVQTRLAKGYNRPDSDLFDPNAFREEVRLVFLNALEYNAKGTDLARYANRFVTFIDAEMNNLPMPDPPAGADADGDGDADADADAAADKPGDKAKPGPASGDKADADKDGEDDDDDDDDLEDDDDEDGKKVAKEDTRADKTPGTRRGSKDDKEARESDADKDTAAGRESDRERGRRDGGDDAAPGSEDDEDDGRERDRLMSRIAMLNKQRDAQLAELELEQSSPLSYDEISALRDEVEALPWETSQRVVDILRQHVDDALKQCTDADPEFVTLEFSAVETKLLRKIESLVKPNQKLQAERDSLARAETEIESMRKRLKRLSDGAGGGKRKRAKKAR